MMPAATHAVNHVKEIAKGPASAVASSQDRAIHRPVPIGNGVLERGMIRFRRRDVEMLRLHIAPIVMLEVRGAVAEEGRETNIEASIQMPENVILHAIEQARPPPTNPRIAPF